MRNLLFGPILMSRVDPLLSPFLVNNYRYCHFILFDHLGAGCALDATTRGLKTAMVELGMGRHGNPCLVFGFYINI
jgi:hypothetical protein